ncbi:MAG: efflux RND transporter permease subunit [Candidatus Riflebacteria bacterium]|nr:efflux RND transporter permease subunit [Candidatus Riflebacteria bacterium]
MNFTGFIANQSRAVLVFVGLLCVAGLFAAFQLTIAIFPQTNFPRIAILVDDGVEPAAKMLVSVTRPIEEAMNSIPGIVRIKSTTMRGSTEISLFFDWKIDILQSLQLVQTRLSQLSSSLPPTAAIRQVDRLTFAVFPVTAFSLISDTRDSASLRDLAANVVRPRLTRLPGISRIGVAGGDVREYHICIDPEKLAARAVSSQQVIDAVKNSNILDSPGLIDENHHLELALVSGQANTPDDLNKIVIATVGGKPITIADVAAIKEGVAPNFTIVTADGHPAVLLNILRQPDANTITVVEEVKAELASLREQLPVDVKIAPFYDQSLYINESIDSVRDSILGGLLLSVAILYVFLQNWGTTFVAVLVIPVTVLATILAMWLVGLSFDLMTMGGLAAAIGLVIDNAIVVVENIFLHRSRGESRRDAVQRAVSEIMAPLVSSTITPVVVFLPLTLLTGVTGVFFRSLALTMAVALITSLVLALSFTPVLAQRFISISRGPGKDRGRPENEHGKYLGAIIRVYEWILLRALNHPLIVLILVAAMVFGASRLYTKVGSEFLPSFDESAFILDYVAPPGSSLAETDRMLLHVEDMLKKTPEVESYSRRTGLQQGDLSITEPNTGDLMVKLKPGHIRSTDAVSDELREKIETSEPALRTEFMGILGDLIGDLTSSPSPIEVKIFSEDTVALRQKAVEIAKVLKKIPGLVDVFDGLVISGPAITFKVDPLRAAGLGVTAEDVSQTVTTALSGQSPSSLLQRNLMIPIRVVLPPSVRSSTDALRGLMLRSSSTGSLFRLDQVASVETNPGQMEIHREGLRQTVAVTARLSESDLGSAIAAVKERIARDIKLPSGMTIEFGGLYEEQQTSFRQLIMALLLAIVLVFIVLLVEFRSFVHPIAIVAGSSLALAGVLVALWITHITLNVVSLMGMIMVVGIVAKNGILMLDSVDDHLASGMGLTDALLHSGRRRFRPVLMTSLATILGMLPLACAVGAGAKLLQPLAVAVIGGLTVALLLSLVLTPMVFFILRKVKSCTETQDKHAD